MTFKQKMAAIESLEAAANIVGSITRLANELGVSRKSYYNWRDSGKVPAEHAAKIEVMTDGSITRKMLRPDLFGR